MTDTNTAGYVRTLQNEATNRGYGDGRTHAAYVDAYGGNPHAEPEVPPRFATVATFYTAAYADGVNSVIDEIAE